MGGDLYGFWDIRGRGLTPSVEHLTDTKSLDNFIMCQILWIAKTVTLGYLVHKNGIILCDWTHKAKMTQK